MSGEFERVPAAASATPSAGFEPPPDRERRNPYYRWLMHLVLPLGLSLLLHVALMTGARFYTFATQARAAVEVGEYAAGLMDDPDASAADAFKWGEQMTFDAAEPQPLDHLPLDDFSRVAPLDLSALSETPGPGAGTGAGEGDLGLGEGRFSLLGTGEGAGESGSGALGGGVGGRGGRLGLAGMWGVRVQANKIVYVVDFSGSIIVAVDDLKRELKRSIGSLRSTQSFNVVIFYGEAGTGGNRFQTEAFAAQLQPANEETRRRFFAWLDTKAPMGGTEPVAAVKRALALKPEAVFFFSDGYFDDSAVAEIAQANRQTQAKIICFVFDELLLSEYSGLPRETDGSRRLRRIAEQNRGSVKIVTGADLKGK